MRAYHDAGETDLAIRHYQAFATLLRRDLKSEPQPETKEVYLRLRDAPRRHGPRLSIARYKV